MSCLNITATRIDAPLVAEATRLGSPLTVSVSDLSTRLSVVLTIECETSTVFDFLRTADGSSLRLADGQILRVKSID